MANPLKGVLLRSAAEPANAPIVEPARYEDRGQLRMVLVFKE